MTPLRSLRSRLVMGSLLWTLGISAVVAVLATALVLHFPRMMGVGHFFLLSVCALGLIAAGLSQVRSGLSPLNQLRARLAAVREGRSPRVEGVYPSEVEPLVGDLNALLEDRERSIARAQAKAGDLAHGLKTPLAVLALEADAAAAAGHEALADTLRQQVARMRRQVDYHLAQAQASASGGTLVGRCALAATVEGLARTMRRLHADRGLALQVEIPAEHTARGQREDLEEMLGNLLDNACKWARSTVRVTSAMDAAGVTITIDDDGPGIDPSLREQVLMRGVRADESATGSGIGLAIVRELAGVYGGSIALSEAPGGGLRARLWLP